MFLPMTMRPMVMAFLVTVLMAGAVQAELKVDITQGKAEPLPIAVSDFFGSTSQEASIGQNMAAVIAADLLRSGVMCWSSIMRG